MNHALLHKPLAKRHWNIFIKITWNQPHNRQSDKYVWK